MIIDLPSGWKLVEYIESTGTQYIDTGFIFNQANNPEIEFDCNATNDGSFHGSQDGSSLRTFCNFDRQTYCGIGNNRISDGRIQNEKHTYKATYESSTNILTTYRDNIEISHGVQSGGFTNKNMFLLEINGGSGTTKLTGKVYRVVFTENSIKVRDFVPVKNETTNEYAMYDSVTKNIYHNAGSGSFSGGPDIPVQTEKKQFVSVKSFPKLPAGYTELEYIESSGTQYIDSGFTPTVETEIEWESAFNSGQMVFGNIGYGTRGGYSLITASSSGDCGIGYSRLNVNRANAGYGGSISSGFYHMKYNKNGFYNITSDMSVLFSTTPIQEDITVTSSLWLFKARNNGSFNNFVGQVKYWIIRDNGVIVRHFIPCKNSDNEIGMYDLITKQFYDNLGTDSFTAGEEVYNYETKRFVSVKNFARLPAGYTELEYIENTELTAGGIIIPYFLKQNDKINVKYEYTDYTEYGHVFGAYAKNPDLYVLYRIGRNTSNLDFYGISYTNYSKDKPTAIEFNKIYDTSLNSDRAINNRVYLGLFNMCLSETSGDIGSLVNYGSKMKIYHFSIDNELDLIPAKNSNGQVGFYDIINDVFYTGNVVQNAPAINTTLQFIPRKAITTVAPFDGLCFTAVDANAKIGYTINGSLPNIHIQSSTDGTNWEDWNGTAKTLTSVGDKLYVKNTANTLTTGTNNYLQFTTPSGKVSASGNCNSLINYAPIYAHCFRNLFYGASQLTTAPELPATTLGNSCYASMFQNCTSLVSAPELPATTLAPYCYFNMFYNCSSLTTAPELPAAETTTECYYSMFQSCSSLNTIPALPATTLADRCYFNMFYSCRNIKLSATQTGDYTNAYRIPTSGTGTVGTNSLNSMFGGTGGSFTGTPTINTTYYTSNEII